MHRAEIEMSNCQTLAIKVQYVGTYFNLTTPKGLERNLARRVCDSHLHKQFLRISYQIRVLLAQPCIGCFRERVAFSISELRTSSKYLCGSTKIKRLQRVEKVISVSRSLGLLLRVRVHRTPVMRTYSFESATKDTRVLVSINM